MARASEADALGPAAGPVRFVQVLVNYQKPSARDLSSELVPWLRARVERAELQTDVAAFAEERAAGRVAGEVPDLVVVLGGDGALLGAVRAFAETPVPTLGINLGRVGFLASTPATRWRETLEVILAGRGELEHRLRMQGEWHSGGERRRAIALNEFCVQRGSHQGLLGAELSVGETWVTEYRADGLLVATPSGSTAYSLSAGGPILAPPVFAFVATPISPQGLATRPLVLHGDEEITIRVAPGHGEATLAIDGQSFFPLEEGGELCLTRHPVAYPLYAMPGLDPYRRLRDRLGWGGGPAPTT